MELKENLKKLRISRGFTQSDVAEKLGFKSHNAYNLWENGKSSPSFDFSLEFVLVCCCITICLCLFPLFQLPTVSAGGFC